MTVLGERGYLGAAVSTQRSNYGIPGGEEEITIDLDQNRVDVEGALRFGAGAVRNLTARFGAADYQHRELEGAEVGTSFFNDYREVRMESEHTLGERVHGAVGAQLSIRHFEAVDDEAFVPPSSTRSAALFAYEDFRASAVLGLQAGLRFERQDAEARRTGVERADDALSWSLGLNREAAAVLTLSVSASRSVKHPNAEELFSNGPHLATRSFEIGNPDLGSETALGLDVTAHAHGAHYRGSASIFTTGFSDYIYEAATGGQQEALPEFRFTQDDARFTGFEIEGELDIVEGDPAARRPHVSLELLGDAVRARLNPVGEPLPRIPPFRFGGGVNYR